MPETTTFNPEAYYDVRLKAAVKVGPIWYRPDANRIRVDGATLTEIIDSVLDYEEVT